MAHGRENGNELARGRAKTELKWAHEKKNRIVLALEGEKTVKRGGTRAKEERGKEREGGQRELGKTFLRFRGSCWE